MDFDDNALKNLSESILTIGNITKLCTDKILIDPKGEVSILQWFTFQLTFLFDRLKLSRVNPITGYKLTKTEMAEILKNVYGNNVDISEYVAKDEKSWTNYGFVKKSIKNTYTSDNLGGKIAFTPVFNESKSDLLFPDDKKPIFIYSSKEEPEMVKNPVLSKQSLIAKPVDDPVPTPPVVLDENVCLSYGKLSWKKNSCYADSILLLIAYRIILHSGSYIEDMLSNFTYTIDNVLDKNQCGENVEDTVELYNNILDMFRSIINNIRDKKIFNVIELFNILKTCPIPGSDNLGDGLYHDSIEFLAIIFNYFRIAVSDANSIRRFYFNDKNNNLDSLILNYNNKLTDLYFNYSIPSHNTLGEPFYDHLESIVSENPIQNFNIPSYLIATVYDKLNIQDLSVEKSLSEDQNQYKYNPIVNKVIRKKDNLKTEAAISSVRVDLSSLITMNTVEQMDVDTYKIIDDNFEYENTGSGTVYYHRDDKLNPAGWKDIKNMPKEIGFKTKQIVKEYKLTNTSEDIIISINRNITRMYEGNMVERYMPLEIKPDEFISINGTQYMLFGINVYANGHYISFYRCNDEFYIYDGLLASSGLDDYIIKIGDYTNLLKYSYKGKSKIVQKQSRMLYYIKK